MKLRVYISHLLEVSVSLLPEDHEAVVLDYDCEALRGIWCTSVSQRSDNLPVLVVLKTTYDKGSPV